MNKIVFSFIFSVLIISCNPKEVSVEASFYYWKQSVKLSDDALNYMKYLDAQKVYIKYFDVAWNTMSNKSKPVAIVALNKEELPKNIEIIPTVFITNQTLSKSNDGQIEDLAVNLAEKIRQVNDENNIENLSEIQLDCDWTLSTKKKFFRLLELIRIQFPNIQLSATIRLHQVKFYKKTGIPPVDRGMLMFYNMGDLSNPETENSILDLKTAEQYLVNFDNYELPLDVALPLFRWGVLKRRGRVIKLMNNLDFEDLKSEKYKSISPTEFEILENHYLNTLYLYKGDVIRIESVSIRELEETAKILNKHIKNKDRTITFYHLDDKVLQHYPKEDLAEDFADKHHALFLGRGDQYPIAMEGALKLKEISYIHAEAYAAGELKHGPLALIDAEMPVIVVAPKNDLIEKLKSNVEEVRARGGLMYVFADSNANFASDGTMKVIDVPVCDDLIAPIVYTIPLQLLSYYVAIIKGTDVDQPRNLAKSVTVE